MTQNKRDPHVERICSAAELMLNANRGDRAYESLLTVAQNLVEHDAVYWKIRGHLEVFHLNRPTEGLVSLRRAWDLDPCYVSAFALAWACKVLHLADEEVEWGRWIAAHCNGSLGNAANQVVRLSYRSETNRHRLRAAVDVWYRMALADGKFSSPEASHAVPSGRKLRIGLFNSSITHIVYYPTFVPLLKYIGADSRFEFILITNADPGVAIYSGILECFAESYNLAGHAHELAARLLLDLRIDILIDMNGFEPLGSLYLMSQRPAQILIGWCHSFHSFGPQLYDYVILDETMLPERLRDVFDEDVLRMPHFCGFYLPILDDEYTPIKERQNDQPLTFGMFNRSSKLTRLTLSLWANILRQFPNSNIVLANTTLSEKFIRDRIQSRLIEHGIHPDRIMILHTLTQDKWIDVFSRVDIGLDTFPFNGGLTTMQTLWFGVPVPTWPGETPAARMSTAVLKTIGHPELVAETPEDYVTLTCDLARDPDRIAQYRQTLRADMLASPLCDAPGFARTFGDLLMEAAARGPRHQRDARIDLQPPSTARLNSRSTENPPF